MLIDATAELPDTPSAAEARLVAFMQTRGYSIAPGALAEASQISFHRGSLWGSLTSFSPRKWGARVTVRGLGTGTFRVALDVNTTGQMVTIRERTFWSEELAAIVAAIEGREPAELAAVDAQLAGPDKRAILTAVTYSLGGAVAFASAQLALRSMGVDLFVGFPGLGAGIGFMLGLQRATGDPPRRPR